MFGDSLIKHIGESQHERVWNPAASPKVSLTWSFRMDTFIHLTNYFLETADCIHENGQYMQNILITVGIRHIREHGFHTVLHGDGVIVARKRATKQLEVYTVEFPSNAPYYLVYEIKPHDKENWIEHFQSELVISRNFIDQEKGIDDIFYRDSYEVNPDFAGFTHTFNSEEYDMVVLVSDGIETFYKVESSTMPYSQPMKKQISHLKMIKDLFKFKDGIDDVFLNKAFSNYMNKHHAREWYHSDDLSMAGLYCP